MGNNMTGSKNNMESLNSLNYDENITDDVLDKMFWALAKEAKAKGLDVTIYNSFWQHVNSDFVSENPVPGLDSTLCLFPICLTDIHSEKNVLLVRYKKGGTCKCFFVDSHYDKTQKDILKVYRMMEELSIINEDEDEDDMNEIEVIDFRVIESTMNESGAVVLLSIFYAISMVNCDDFETTFRETMNNLDATKCRWWIKNCVADEIVYSYDKLLFKTKGAVLQ